LLLISIKISDLNKTFVSEIWMIQAIWHLRSFFQFCDMIRALNVDIWGHRGSKGPSINRKNMKGSLAIYQNFVSRETRKRLETRFGKLIYTDYWKFPL
jgi:hypothetical protein